MSVQRRATHPKDHLASADVDGFDSLTELALDMRSSWNHSTDQVWRLLDPVLWDITRNPWVILQTVSRAKLQSLLADPAFRQTVDDLVQARREDAEAPAWFQQTHADSPLGCVAYFSMEFMLSEALPIYSGGLGNVAGDQLKAASDLGVPVVGIGLLYQQGYFRQVIDKDGAQQALFPYNDPGQLPITPLRKADGEWLRLEIALPGYPLWLRAWQVQVGRVKLYLLDSNDAANYPEHRGITSELYGGGPELRLKQELLLGIGGWRLLAALGIKPEVCHLNEGHAAFAVLERARSFMQETGHDFAVALAATQGGQPVHHPYRGRCRLRPFPARPHRAVPRRLCANPTRHFQPRAIGSGPPGSERRSGALQHRLSGNPWQRGSERCESLAWPRQQAAVRTALSPLAARRKCRSSM